MYDGIVPLLIDGNNLLHALAKAGRAVSRSGLCRLLGELAGGGRKVSRGRLMPARSLGTVRVVFDGRPPAGALAEQVADERIDVVFSGRRSADEVIAESIAADSAPRRLTVVSTDRAIRKAARRRRCKVALSEDFAEELLRLLERPPRRSATEPAEKRRGLTPRQAEAWISELELGETDSCQPEGQP